MSGFSLLGLIMSHYRLLFWLAATAGVAALLVGLAFRLPWGFQLLAGLCLATWFAAELLVRNLPEVIREVQIGNGVRHDGSSSKGRQSVEQVARDKLRWNFVFLFSLLVYPNLFMMWMADRVVVPRDVATETVSQFHPDQDACKSGIEAGRAELQFDHWKRDTTPKVLSKETHKRLLWQGWPVLIAGFIIWVVICCELTRQYYLSLLKRFDHSARYRAQRYFYRDMGRMKPFADKDISAGPKRHEAHVNV